MQITPPFGYKEVVPVLKTQRLRLPGPGELPPFVRGSNAVPLSPTEFQPAGREFPIVFTSNDNGKSFAPVAVLGLASGENLFVNGSGWSAGVYVPAYLRRYPFCMARVAAPAQGEAKQGEEQPRRLICVEKEHLDEGGEALFEGDKPTERWAGIERLLTEYEADLERGRELCAILADYALLEPFTMQAQLPADKGGEKLNLTGMHRVSEKNLENLNAAQLKNLVRKGILARIYLHLISLANFARLLERRLAAEGPK
ncbi:MAG TPA: SapC family protein [Burkholderiales bacterium]|nr:SapC family protein [Burkholderiales bacterium]